MNMTSESTTYQSKYLTFPAEIRTIDPTKKIGRVLEPFS